MNPTKKDPVIEGLLTSITKVDRPTEIKANRCVICHQPITPFLDELSVREYRISGMCQKCQDSVFEED